METIEKIKEELAEEYGYSNWYGAVNTCSVEEMDSICNEIAQRAFNAALELAAEKAELSANEFVGTKWVKTNYDHFSINDGCYFVVDKESILYLKLKD